jgi:tRNA (guanine10-N2)-dimethyltransferase
MNTKIIFDVSKEYPLLAHDEIISCFISEHIQFQIFFSTENVLIIESELTNEQIRYLAYRLSMSFSIGRLLFTGIPTVSEMMNQAKNHSISITGSLAVRYKNRSEQISSKPLVQAIADVYTLSTTVDLTNPDHTIFLLITNEKVYVSEQIAIIDRSFYEQRKAHLRPFFSPISLHPKIARALVNISQAKPGDVVLDPFCGTGGFLIEAGLMNMKVIGSDISEEMIAGAQKNLLSYPIHSFSMITADIASLPDLLSDRVDAIVTDLPYGKATSTRGEEIHALHTRAIISIQQILKPGARAVIGSFSEDLKIKNYEQLDHIVSYPLRVHRSLTRWFHVFEKRP